MRRASTRVAGTLGLARGLRPSLAGAASRARGHDDTHGMTVEEPVALCDVVVGHPCGCTLQGHLAGSTRSSSGTIAGVTVDDEIDSRRLQPLLVTAPAVTTRLAKPVRPLLLVSSSNWTTGPSARSVLQFFPRISARRRRRRALERARIVF